MWVGAISGAFEWWKRDRSGRAKKYGKRRDLRTARTINFKRSHFADTEPGDDQVFSINCDQFRDFFAMKLLALAAKRCKRMLVCKKSQGRSGG